MAATPSEPRPGGGVPYSAPGPERPSVAVLVACYNRVQVTLPNLGRLIEGLDRWKADYQIFLLDDASPDMTGAKVREAYPQITVVEGTGSLFWNRGMHSRSRD